MKFFKSMLCVLMAVTAVWSVAQAADARYYTKLDQVQPSDTQGKTEALVFFSYSCPHCAEMEPLFQDWEKHHLPQGAVIKPVPVAFNAAMEPMQKLFFILQALDRMDLHVKAFDAIHKQRKRLFTRDAIQSWLADQGIDKATFNKLYDSFGINAQVKRANTLTEVYRITGTPTIAVAGKYIVSPGSFPGTPHQAYEGAYRVARELLDESVAH